MLSIFAIRDPKRVSYASTHANRCCKLNTWYMCNTLPINVGFTNLLEIDFLTRFRGKKVNFTRRLHVLVYINSLCSYQENLFQKGIVLQTYYKFHVFFTRRKKWELMGFSYSISLFYVVYSCTLGNNLMEFLKAFK